MGIRGIRKKMYVPGGRGNVERKLFEINSDKDLRESSIESSVICVAPYISRTNYFVSTVA